MGAWAGLERFTGCPEMQPPTSRSLPSAPAATLRRSRRRKSGAPVRAAAGAQDAAIFLTAAFTGLRMGELLALRWRDVDFARATVRVRASHCNGQLTRPKSGKVRAVPLAPDVASALARLGDREDWVGDDDLVFAGEAGGYLDGSALRRRYKLALAAAALRPLRFHDLRHTSEHGDRARGHPAVQEWMGHADIQTKMRLSPSMGAKRHESESQQGKGICSDLIQRARLGSRRHARDARAPRSSRKRRLLRFAPMFLTTQEYVPPSGCRLFGIAQFGVGAREKTREELFFVDCQLAGTGPEQGIGDARTRDIHVPPVCEHASSG
jgi:integrase-like protein